MKRLLFICLLILPAQLCRAAPPTIDSCAVGFVTPWSAQIVWRADSLVWCKVYYGTDTTGSAYDYVTDSAQAINHRYHGNIWCQDLTGGTTYYYKLFAWFTGQDGDSVYGTAGSFVASASADTAVITTDTLPFICNDADRYYHLTEDKNARWSAIECLGDGMTIDLRGNTVTYCSGDSIPVDNWSFENDSTNAELPKGWTFSDTTRIKRREGHYYWDATGQPTVYGGDWAAMFQTDEYSGEDTIEYIESNETITIPAGAGEVYAVSCMIYGYPKDAPAWAQAHVITAKLEFIDEVGDTAWTGCYADNYGAWVEPPDHTPTRAYPWGSHTLSMRGWTYMYFLVYPDTGDYVGKIRLTIQGRADDGLGGSLDSVYADCFSIDQAYQYGIVSPYHTTYGDSNWVLPPGQYMAMRPNSWKLAIYNGTIRCARRSHWTHGTSAIYSYGHYGQDDWTISGVTAVGYGVNVRLVDHQSADLDTITFNHFADSGKVISRRDSGYDNLTTGSSVGYNYVAFNNIDQCRQTGIGVGADDTTSNNVIEWNYIHSNVGIWHTNGFGIQFGGYQNHVRYNTIIGLMNGTGGGGLSGMQFNGNGNLVYDNFVYARTGASQEYADYVSYGIQLESSDAWNGIKTKNSEVYNNIVYAVEGNALGFGSAAIRATNPWEDNYVHNNRLFAIDSVSGGPCDGISASWSNEYSYLRDEYEGPYIRQWGNHTYGNYIQADDYCIRVSNNDTLGQWAFSQDTFNLTAGGTKTFYFIYSDSNHDTNCVFEGNAAKDDITISGDGNLTTWWTLHCTANADGISIWAIDSTGATVDSGVTVSGIVDLYLREFLDDFTAANDTTFNRYSIYADSAGVKDSSALYESIAWDTLAFAGFAGGPPPRKVKIRR